MDGVKTSPISCAALVLTQEYVNVFDVNSDTQLQSFPVADVDCQLAQASSTTHLVFSQRPVTVDSVSYANFFYKFHILVSIFHCYDYHYDKLF